MRTNGARSATNVRWRRLLASATCRLDWLCDLLLHAGMVLLLIATPLAFGAVHAWAFSLMEVGSFSLIIGWMGQAFLRDSNVWRQKHEDITVVVPVRLRYCRSLVLPIVLFIGLILFQLMPLPPGLLQVLSPATHQLYQTALPGWPQKEPFTDLLALKIHSLEPVTAPPLEPQPSSRPASDASRRTLHAFSNWRSVSLYPQASLVELFKLLAYFSFFALVVFKGSPRLIRGTLITLGSGLALLAFLQHVTWNGKLLWFFAPSHWLGLQPSSEDRLHGPFVNPDHFAGYLEMVLPLVVSAMLVSARRWRQRDGEYQRSGVMRFTQVVVAFGSVPVLSCGLLLLAAIIILTALVFTFSRGGFSAAFASLFFMAWLLWPSARKMEEQPSHPYVWMKLGRAACILGFLSVPVIYLEYPQVFDRFLRIPEEHIGRSAVYAATLALWRDFPILGVGLGNFRDVFPLYQPPAADQILYNYAHNDYLQLLAETGLLGFSLLTWSIAGVLLKVARSWRKVTCEQRLWLAGVLSGVAAILLHSLVDFNLHIPANALLFVTLLALSVRL